MQACTRGMLPALLRAIDSLSGLSGLVGGCLVLPLLSVMLYEVIARFFFDAPTFWAYELAYMLTGAHFALGITYVLREDKHVRIDFLYARLAPRARAAIDLGVDALFLLPLVGWMTWALVRNALEAFAIGQVSGESSWNPVIWPLYGTVALGFAAFTLQIFAEVVRKAAVAAGSKPPP